MRGGAAIHLRAVPSWIAEAVPIAASGSVPRISGIYASTPRRKPWFEAS